MDDLPFGEPLTAGNPAAPAPRKCRHPRARRVFYPAANVWRCTLCFHEFDPASLRRGKNNRNRGNAIERSVGKQLGLKRVGQFGGATDLGESHDPFAVSVKSGSGYFSERYWDQLKRQPVAAGQTALLVVTDAPGSAYKRRAMVVIDIADWLLWHGPGTEGRP